MHYINKFWQFYFRMPIILRLLSTIIVIMFLFGILIHIVEPIHFPSIFDGIWWAIVTGSTVGYGDFVPHTVIGKIIAIVLILAGGGLLTLYIATFSAGAVKHEQELSKGKITFKGKNHIIFVGWNERTKQLSEMILNKKTNEEIVLIDHTLKQLPYRQHPIHFIKGYAYDDDILKMAKISDAKYAVITADQNQKERQADQNSILTTMAMKGNNPELFVITEILTKEQISNANRAGANTVIRSNDFMSTLFYHEIFRSEPIQPFDLLLEMLASQQFNQFKLPHHLVGKSFLTCSDYYMENEQLLIGLVRRGELMLHPSSENEMEVGDLLIVLTQL